MNHHGRRKLLQTLGAMISIAAGLGACLPVAAPHKLRTHEGEIAQVGAGYRCVFEDTRVTKDCDAYLGEEVFWSYPDTARFSRWRADAKWDTARSVIVERKGGAKLRIIAHDDARRTSLRNLTEHGAVVALILADPNGPADPVYPIGGKYTRDSAFTDSFFVAIDTYRRYPSKNDSVVPFANARLYGIRDGKLVRMKGRGFINWCRHSMKAQSNLATFASCAAREELAKYEKKLGTDSVRRLLESRSAALVAGGVSQDFVNQLTQNNNEPGSLPCAAGCCYVSFDPQAPDYPDLATNGFKLPWADAPHRATFVRERERGR